MEGLTLACQLWLLPPDDQPMCLPLNCCVHLCAFLAFLQGWEPTTVTALLRSVPDVTGFSSVGIWEKGSCVPQRGSLSVRQEEEVIATEAGVEEEAATVACEQGREQAALWKKSDRKSEWPSEARK